MYLCGGFDSTMGGEDMPARKRGPKPRYKVNVAMQAWDIAKAGAAITLKVRHRGGHLGTIEIGQGSLRWKPPYGRFKRIPWSRVADILNNQ
jgi:hypothetical protein